MTPRRWGVGGWLVAAAAGFVAAGGLVGLLVWDRRLFLLAVWWMCSLYLAYRIPNRNLLAELEAAQMRLSAYNASDSRADLAEAPLTPPGGYEVEPFMADSQRCVWCLQPRHDGMCQRDDLPDLVTEAYAAESGRIKGTGGVVSSSSAVTFSESDGCVVPLQEWADRLAALPGCVWESCPHPENCTGECRWNIDQPDLDASDGPRSLPTPRAWGHRSDYDPETWTRRLD